MRDDDSRLAPLPPTRETPPPVHRSPSRGEWLLAFAISVVALVLVLLFIGPPHVM
jgi:hypothetical protein